VNPVTANTEERLAAGKRLRERLPHSRHAEYRQASERADPVAVIEAENVPRIADLVPVRHARMLVSPFAFFRGAAGVMAADLATTPTTGVAVQACGDMHVSNFGVFGSAERSLVFGINDFDETLPGPWEWDVKRLATSVIVSTRFLGVDSAEARAAAETTVASYRDRIRGYAELGHLATWYARIEESDVLAAVSPAVRKNAKSVMRQARRQTNLQVLGKLTDLIDDRRRIIEEPPLVVHEAKTAAGRPIEEAVDLFLRSYAPSLPPERRVLLERYQVVDVARKAGGVGSMGTRCWIIFLEGNGPDDPLFLQLKEAEPSVLKPYVAKSRYAHEGKRVVVGQRLIQGAPDIFLGWGKQDGVYFYVRQLRDLSGGVEIEPETAEGGLPGLMHYCSLCGWALALAHSKSGDPATIAGYLGRSDAFDTAVTQFAEAYADQNERDYESFARAARAGRIEVA
jgi:uncharacterized protein (DUF2252 family)